MHALNLAAAECQAGFVEPRRSFSGAAVNRLVGEIVVRVEPAEERV